MKCIRHPEYDGADGDCEHCRREQDGMLGTLPAKPASKTPDCPPCPECKTPIGAPIHTHHRGAEYPREVRLVCHACGHGWIGTDAEVEQAERAEAAWEAQGM